MNKKVWDQESGRMIEIASFEGINNSLEAGNHILDIIDKVSRRRRGGKKRMDECSEMVDLYIQTIQRHEILEMIKYLRAMDKLSEEEYKLALLAHANVK